MLIATAGHIDHGKTALVRALTGVETDRLPEEKARGISIDLGFAYWTPDEGPTLGFIDVPGHERFVRNMLAGVGGVDFALVVIAADDGVMPQTVEHVQILDLLGVGRGAVAITKCDRASPERIGEVRGEARALIDTTRLAGAPMFEVSSTTGQGIATLGQALQAARRDRPQPRAARNFRLTIDRGFIVAGAGTVVTGTVLDGALAVGERLIVAPSRVETRARVLQSAGKTVDRIEAGQRCAVNLAGLELAQVHRGDWLVAPDGPAPTTQIEARVRVLALHDRPLKHNSQVHLHAGAADIGARVLIPARAAIEPGGEAIARLSLSQPAILAVGDPFVLRDGSGRRLIGGGMVVDPVVAPGRRRAAERAPVTAAMALADPAQSFAALLAIPGQEVDAAAFAQAFNLAPKAADALFEDEPTVRLGGLVLPTARIVTLRDQILTALAEFHHASPDIEAMAVRDLMAAVPTQTSSAAFLAVLKDLADCGQAAFAAGRIRLASHVAQVSPIELALWRRLQTWQEERGYAFFTLREAVAELRAGEAQVKTVLARRRAGGEVWKAGENKFLMRDQIVALTDRAARLDVDGSGFTVAQVRDAIGIGRNQTIRLLEFLDVAGVTRRQGDLRWLRKGYRRLLGVADADDGL